MGGRVTLYCMWPATASEDSVDEWSPGSTVPWLRGAHLILWGGWHKNLFTTNDCFHCHKSVWNHHPFLLRFLKCNIVFSIRHWRAKRFFFSIIYIFFTLGVCNMPAIRSSKHEQNTGRRHRMRSSMQSLLLLLQGHQTKPGPKPILLTVSSVPVSPSKLKPHLLTPVSQVSRPVPEPSSHHVTPENLSDLKDNSLQMLNVFLWEYHQVY